MSILQILYKFSKQISSTANVASEVNNGRPRDSTNVSQHRDREISTYN